MSKLIDAELKKLIQKTQPEIWLDIEKESVKKTKEFMKALFQSNIPGSWHWFDKLDCSVSLARQPDPGMTDKKFIRNIRKNRFVRLQINRKEHPPSDPFKTMNVIGFCVCMVKLADSPGIERFAWHCTPIEPGYFKDHPNYKKVDEIFKKVYLADMRTYESL